MAAAARRAVIAGACTAGAAPVAGWARTVAPGAAVHDAVSGWDVDAASADGTAISEAEGAVSGAGPASGVAGWGPSFFRRCAGVVSLAVADRSRAVVDSRGSPSGVSLEPSRVLFVPGVDVRVRDVRAEVRGEADDADGADDDVSDPVEPEEPVVSA